MLRDFQRRKYQRLKWLEKRNVGERVVTAGPIVRREKGSKEKSQIFANGGNFFPNFRCTYMIIEKPMFVD